MNNLLAAYDLNEEKNTDDREKVLKAIKKCSDDWLKLSESAYLLSTEMSPEQVVSLVQPYLDSNDRLTVVSITTPCAFHDPDMGVLLQVWFEHYLPDNE